MSQEEPHNLNILITRHEIQSVIKNTSSNKSSASQRNSTKLMPILLKLFQIILKNSHIIQKKIEEKGTLPNSFYKAILMP